MDSLSDIQLVCDILNTRLDISILYFPNKNTTKILLLAAKILLGDLHEHIYLVSLDQMIPGWMKELIDDHTLKLKIPFGRYKQPPSIKTRYIFH